MSEEMTMEQAITELSILLNEYQDTVTGDALDIGITALEAESCSDAISRQAAIEAYKNRRLPVYPLEDLPSVHAEPMRWHYDDFPPSDPEKRYVVVRMNELFVKPILDTADYYTGDGMYSEKPWHFDGGYSCYPSEILAWADVGEIEEIIKHISGKGTE